MKHRDEDEASCLNDEERRYRDEATAHAADALRLNEEMAAAFREGRVSDGARLGGEAVAAAIRGVVAAAHARTARAKGMH